MTDNKIFAKKLKFILFDIDNTLVYGKKADRYYSRYPRALEKELARCLGVSLSKAKAVADKYRTEYAGRGELAFEYLGFGMECWFDAIQSIDPKKYLEPLPKVKKLLLALKRKGLKLVAVTDGPRPQAERILRAVGINPNVFEFLIGWERGNLPPKFGSADIFRKLIRQLKVRPEEMLMVGDSVPIDIIPAMEVGLKAVYIADDNTPTNGWEKIPSVISLLELIDK